MHDLYVPRGLADWPMGTLRVRAVDNAYAVNVVNDDSAVSKGLTKGGRWMRGIESEGR